MKQRLNGVAFLVLLGTAFAAPAGAQTTTESDTGSNIRIPRRARISDDPGLSAADRARLAMAEFARCTVDRQSIQVKKLLMLPADKVDRQSIAPLAVNECLDSGAMRFKPLLLRGTLFTELYRRRSAAEARGLAWRLPVTSFDPTISVDTANQELAIQIGLLDFAVCVIARDPVAAKAVVMAPTASKVQDAAFARLLPNLGPCLSVGQKITLGKMVLEGSLGEVLYRGTVPSTPSAPKEAK